MAKRSHRFLLSGATDSNIDALVNCLIEDRGIFQVVAGDHPDGYEIRVIFGKKESALMPQSTSRKQYRNDSAG